MGVYRNLFLFTIVCTLISAVLSISCYQCLYDNNVPDLPKTSIDCATEPFEPSKVKQEAGFKQCYKAVVYEDDKIVSAHRGGGSSSVFEIAEKVSRDQDSIIILYCNTDLCNGAPSSGVSLGFITSTLVMLRSLTH